LYIILNILDDAGHLLLILEQLVCVGLMLEFAFELSKSHYTDVDHFPLELQPMPYTSVAVEEKYMNASVSADTGLLPKRNICNG
jgi:hypothetical protein